MAITATFSGYISVVDSTTGAQALQKVMSSLATTGVSFGETSTLLVPTSPTSISLPIGTVNFLYIKNLSLTNTVTVTWTPQGGASNVVSTLNPGDCIMFAKNGSNGITALSVQASGASTPIEYILAG